MQRLRPYVDPGGACHGNACSQGNNMAITVVKQHCQKALGGQISELEAFIFDCHTMTMANNELDDYLDMKVK